MQKYADNELLSLHSSSRMFVCLSVLRDLNNRWTDMVLLYSEDLQQLRKTQPPKKKFFYLKKKIESSPRGLLWHTNDIYTIG